MDKNSFDHWLAELNLSFWGTAQHKINAAQFFERRENEGALLLDLRSPEEAGELAISFALPFRIHRWIRKGRPSRTWSCAGRI